MQVNSSEHDTFADYVIKENRLLPMEEPDVRICPFDRLAVQLEDQAQHSVSSGVLRSKIQLHVPEAYHSQLDMHRIYQ